ncbi:hypothetical protein DPMN_178400 [Dreissena polymorpha]|uniref:Uncharacterized protein n=1 Tax=Dreissena polymorpha TaxID=45954 RepID=A0A9D4EE40_DREPO|nr:hypothetical protein DPMN_178400 [Dreissena polymorpha]
MGGISREFQDLINKLYERASAYGMEVSTEKSKINSTTNTGEDITMNVECRECHDFVYMKH